VVAFYSCAVSAVDDKFWALLNDEGSDFLSNASIVVESLELTDGLWGELGAGVKAKNILSHICSRLSALDLGCHDRETRNRMDGLRVRACLLAQRFHVMSLV